MGRIRTLNLKRKRPRYKEPKPLVKPLTKEEAGNLILSVFGSETDEKSVKLCAEVRAQLNK